MPNCAQCAVTLGDAHRRESGQFSECGLCKSERVPEPALYCSSACAKLHWKGGHSAWHDRTKAFVEKSETSGASPKFGTEEHAETMRSHMASNDEYFRLCAQATQARARHDFRKAVKLAKKAIAMDPTCPSAHFELAAAYDETGDHAGALPVALKAMDLADKGRPQGHPPRGAGLKGGAGVRAGVARLHHKDRAGGERVR